MAHRRASGNPSEGSAAAWEEPGRKTEAGRRKPTLEALFSSESTQISPPQTSSPRNSTLRGHKSSICEELRSSNIINYF